MSTTIKVTLDDVIDVIDLRSFTSNITGPIPAKGIVCPHSFVEGACKFLGKDNPYLEDKYFFNAEGGIIYYSEDPLSSDMIQNVIPKASTSTILVDDSVPPEVIIQALGLGLNVTKLETKLVTFI